MWFFGGTVMAFRPTKALVLFVVIFVIAIVCMVTVMTMMIKDTKAPDTASAIRREMAEGAERIEFRVRQAHFVLVRIPPGECEMGSNTGRANEMPVRKARVSRPFYLGQFEITQFQYKQVMGNSPLSNFSGDSLPVDGIVYSQAREFCTSLSRLVGLSITLPTEAQWEYACRAGTNTKYSSGETSADLGQVGWYEGNAGRAIHPVGVMRPNAWGLYDMHGNVWEPCLDEIRDRSTIVDIDPVGETHEDWGAMRGGGWMHGPEYCRAATSLVTDEMFGGMGIRIAINP